MDVQEVGVLKEKRRRQEQEWVHTAALHQLDQL